MNKLLAKSRAYANSARKELHVITREVTHGQNNNKSYKTREPLTGVFLFFCFYCSGIWVAAAVVASPPMYGWGEVEYIPSVYLCLPSSQSYLILLLILLYVVTCGILGYLYIAVAFSSLSVFHLHLSVPLHLYSHKLVCSLIS